MLKGVKRFKPYNRQIFIEMNELINRIQIPDNITHVKLDIGLSYGAPRSQNWLSFEKDLFVFGFEPNIDSVNNILNGNIINYHPGHDPIANEYINNVFTIIPVALSNVE